LKISKTNKFSILDLKFASFNLLVLQGLNDTHD
jgi:hypothetical protein